jgi:hypothetical protein
MTMVNNVIEVLNYVIADSEVISANFNWCSRIRNG